MTPCDSCEKEVATNSKICPHCGHERTTMSGIVALASGFVCLSIPFVISSEPQNLDFEGGLFALATFLGSAWVCYKALMRWRNFI